MALEPGRLDTPIVFLKPQVFRDGAGAATKTWQVAGPVVWATYSPITTRDRISSPTQLPISGGTLTIRYRGPIEHAWRVDLNGETFQIVGVSHFGRNEYTVITIEKADG